MTPFVYRLKSKEGHFYYGCRYSRGCHPSDLWSTYYTSSNTVKDMIREHGKDFFSYKIVMVCKTQEEALKIERTLISRTYKIPGCLNHFLCKKDGTPVYFGTFGELSEETKLKISLATQGVKRTLETRLKISEGKSGKPWSDKHRSAIESFQQTTRYIELRNKITMVNKIRTKTPEEIAAISAKLTGIKRSDETRLKMSESTKASQAAIPIYKRPRALKLKSVWAMAAQCHEVWKTGASYYIFCRDFNRGENIAVFRSMYKMFEGGWVPSQDEEYKEYMSDSKIIIENGLLLQ